MSCSKKIKWAYIKGMWLAIIVSAFFLPAYMKPVRTGNNRFTISLNGVKVGYSASDDVEDLLRKARLQVASESEEMIMLETEVSCVGEEVSFGRVDSDRKIIENMARVMRDSEKGVLHRSYTVKVNEFTVNLASSEEVLRLLDAVLNQYDEEDSFSARLVLDPARELNVLTTQIVNRDAEKHTEEAKTDFHKSSGAEGRLEEAFYNDETSVEKEFEDYDLGLISLEYGDPVEVVEAYLPLEALTPVEDAIREMTKEQEKNKIYEVVAGDTLSEIAEENGLTMEELVAMNPTIDDANSVIRVGDEITVTSPEPELSVIRREQLYYEEDYDEDVIYVPNDDWYTNQQVTLQEPSAGHRKVVSIITYRNNSETSVDIQKEEVTLRAVAKRVERGTKIPPTYIRPISGGRQSSGFGRRNAPTKGASTYHKGVDWATPVGTSVVASCGGTVVKAGWGSGYGYVVYINHIDGRQTRYGHLSKVLVKAGDKVNQGQKIALSGNTGVSTGPHLHFEILIGGSQVNPLKYLS